MLTRGLAQGIQSTGGRAVDAATNLAADTLDSMSALSAGIDIPLTTTATALSNTTLTPQGLAGIGMGVDVASLVEATAQSVLAGLNIHVVLSDETLVGILGPALNERLGLIGQRQSIMLGRI